MQRWMTSHQHAAVQQLQQLQAVLRTAQLQAEVTAGTAEVHQQNIQLLSQKKHQYDQQMSDLHNHLVNVGLAPQVSYCSDNPAVAHQRKPIECFCPMIAVLKTASVLTVVCAVPPSGTNGATESL